MILSQLSRHFPHPTQDDAVRVGLWYEKQLSCARRRKTGAYFTSPSLASEIIRRTLEPHIYEGVLDGRARHLWRLRDSSQLESIRICDPALGGGIFLVCACQYLASHLLSAWHREGNIKATVQDARRLVAHECLWGADVDADAVCVSQYALSLIVPEHDFSTSHLSCADTLRDKILPENFFHAVVGNPPFLGGRKIRATLGDEYFSYLTHEFAPGASGNADLCAFFFRKAFSLIKEGGTCGLLATNSISQGDTRSVSLEYLIKNGAAIYAADENIPWDGDAAVVTSVVYFFKKIQETSERAEKAVHDEKSAIKHISELESESSNSVISEKTLLCSLNGCAVPYITSSLKTEEIAEQAACISENKSRCYQGVILSGKGFILTLEEAENLLEKAPHCVDVIRPYYTGNEIFNDVRHLPHRLVIDFQNWPLAKAEEEYPEALKILRERVFPERKMVRRKRLRQLWWQFSDRRPTLLRALAPLTRTLVQTRHSKYVFPSFMDTCTVWGKSDIPGGKSIFSESCVVFPTDSYAEFALLNSCLHDSWVRETSGSLGRELRYTPSNCFYTFPYPEKKALETLFPVGKILWEMRNRICVEYQTGLTALYSRLHNRYDMSSHLIALRQVHDQLENAVLNAYGWGDLTRHSILGFYRTPCGERFTLSNDVRAEVKKRLLAENLVRV